MISLKDNCTKDSVYHVMSQPKCADSKKAACDISVDLLAANNLIMNLPFVCVK